MQELDAVDCELTLVKEEMRKVKIPSKINSRCEIDKKVGRVATCLVAVVVLALNAKAQLASVPPDDTCNGSSAVTVTVFDESGRGIPNAFVMLRGEASPKESHFNWN